MKLSPGTSAFVPTKNNDYEVVQHDDLMMRSTWRIPAVVNHIPDLQADLHWQ